MKGAVEMTSCGGCALAWIKALDAGAGEQPALGSPAMVTGDGSAVEGR